jgi:hypothetical protein
MRPGDTDVRSAVGGRRDSDGRAVVWILAATIITIGAAITITVVLAGRHHRHTTGSPKTCNQSECVAHVNTVRRSPRVTVFFGQSCAGADGTWYLNAVQGGASSVVHAAFYLRWSFAPNSPVAQPNGKVVISGGTGVKITMTVEHGAERLAATRTGYSRVTGSGTLAVQLTGTRIAPTLTFTEHGLTTVERGLNLVSPFGVVGNQPLTLPISVSTERSGC